MRAVLAEYPVPLLDLSSRELFWKTLNLVHSVIVASEPLLELAADVTTDAAYRDYLRTHLEEERGHAEWLHRDLEELGSAPVLVRDGAELAGLQYYLIRHVGPECLLGYMYVLEARPMPLEHVEVLEAMHGCGTATLRFHSEHDPDHAGDVLRQIERFADRSNIEMSARWTAEKLSQAMGKL